jgi:hypothetical protein
MPRFVKSRALPEHTVFVQLSHFAAVELNTSVQGW